MKITNFVLGLMVVFAPTCFAVVQGVHCDLKIEGTMPDGQPIQPLSFDLSSAIAEGSSASEYSLSQNIYTDTQYQHLFNIIGLGVGFWRDDVSFPSANRFYMILFDYPQESGGSETILSRIEVDPNASIIVTIFGTSRQGWPTTGSCNSY